MNNNIRKQILVSPELLSTLKQHCNKQNITITEYLRQLIEKELKNPTLDKKDRTYIRKFLLIPKELKNKITEKCKKEKITITAYIRFLISKEIYHEKNQ